MFQPQKQIRSLHTHSNKRRIVSGRENKSWSRRQSACTATHSIERPSMKRSLCATKKVGPGPRIG